ncbi:hypothetical protein VTK26DRAFT_2824 [Humicola hyalothermophila]
MARIDTPRTDAEAVAEPTQSIPAPEAPVRQDFGAWRPSIVIGSPLWLEGEDPSALEVADRKIAQTRLWAQHYQGPEFERIFQEAVRERQQLDETSEENTQPRSALATTRASAVEDRLETLRFILQDCQFPPERANIEAAIAGYESGGILYSDSYTLIWAGRIVDRCPDYDSFTVDRNARLNRYEAEHGPGWLWYEPPLSGGEGTVRGPSVLMKKGMCLENKPDWRQRSENIGHYRILMGFRRRKERVARDPPASRSAGQRWADLSRLCKNKRCSASTPAPGAAEAPPPKRRGDNKKNPHGFPETVPDPDGPRVFLEMLLDSGATFPCIFGGDLAKMRIDPHRYAAQSARKIATADSVVRMRVYELDVGIYAPDGSSLVNPPPRPDPASPSTPYAVAGSPFYPVPAALASSVNSSAPPPPPPPPPTPSPSLFSSSSSCCCCNNNKNDNNSAPHLPLLLPPALSNRPSSAPCSPWWCSRGGPTATSTRRCRRTG